MLTRACVVAAPVSAAEFRFVAEYDGRQKIIRPLVTHFSQLVLDQ